MNEEVLDQNVDFDRERTGVPADPKLIRKAHFWAIAGGIGGIVLGHKLAYNNHFIKGRFHFRYDRSSRLEGKRAQRTGLFIWIPLYLLLIGGYYYWILTSVL